MWVVCSVHGVQHKHLAAGPLARRQLHRTHGHGPHHPLERQNALTGRLCGRADGGADTGTSSGFELSQELCRVFSLCETAFNLGNILMTEEYQ